MKTKERAKSCGNGNTATSGAGSYTRGRLWDRVDGAVAKTPSSHCRGPRFGSWSGN